MKSIKKLFLYGTTLMLLAPLAACSNDDPNPEPNPNPSDGKGLFILNEGNFMYGNASLSFYDTENKKVTNDVFFTANDQKLGDTATSMTMYGGKGWVVVNNSNVIFAIDPDTYLVQGHITGLTSPRYIHFVNDTKAYVTQMYTNEIAIVNPKTYSVIGHITVDGMDSATGSTEEVIQIGKYAYINCWSMQKNVIKIDTDKDKIVATTEVGIQPKSMACVGDDIWVLCDGGGWDQNPVGYERPSLVRLNWKDMEVSQIMGLPYGSVSNLRYSRMSGKPALYWLKDTDVMYMELNVLSGEPEEFFKGNTYYYGFTISPTENEFYLADAIDYQQPGVVYRYSADGTQQDKFTVGVIPGAFCWK